VKAQVQYPSEEGNIFSLRASLACVQ